MVGREADAAPAGSALGGESTLDLSAFYGATAAKSSAVTCRNAFTFLAIA